MIEFALRQWLLLASAAGLLLTSLYAGRVPAWSARELEVLFLLFALFVAVAGLRRSGLLDALSRRLERGRGLAVRLVLATFFLSMLLTNDVVLVMLVPLTLAMDVGRKDVLVILEALAANAGSALTPFGNPQNLYIYWFYEVPAAQFMAAIAPFTLAFLLLLVLAATLWAPVGDPRRRSPPQSVAAGAAGVHGGVLLVVLLAVLHLLPLWAVLPAVAFGALVDRGALRVDYALLASFLFFFGLSDNLRVLLAAQIDHAGHVFLFSALASQVIGNVPAALLFAEFTPHWDALLWGVSAGGFGSLFGSLANLIAYRLYIEDRRTSGAGAFTLEFLFMGYVALFVAAGLYWYLHGGVA